MNRPTLLLVLLASLPLAGCFGGAKPPPELLTLTPAQTRAPGEIRSAQEGHVITVTPPGTPDEIAVNRIPVYVAPTQVQYLTGPVWVGKPNELFRQLLSETLAARTGWTVLDPAVYTQVQGMVLGGELQRFGYDPARGEAVVVFDASLARPGAAVTTNRFEARAPVSAADAATVAAALNQAANQVAGQVADWAGR
ncbi:MAG TPA: ABC-type transport auxiliary lipoprotein family protein [Allosphingosinicella sp.]|jgi:cholesterol transport system auxiliary component|nr:ABC-type transport auxiliary lipoprotein family protein [Allosphingosinicella sp.]